MKTKNKRNYLKEKGITLIALVVTIVVLLILAGVSINAVFGQDGIIQKAKDSQNKMDEATQNDLDSINELNNWIDGKINGSSGGDDKPQTSDLPSTDKTTPYYPDTTFTKLEGTDLSNGLVIKDTSGNEYVWIEVPKTAEVYPTAGLKITNFTVAEYTAIETDFREYLYLLRSKNIRVILLLKNEKEIETKIALENGIYDLVFGNFYPSQIKEILDKPKTFSDIAKIYKKLFDIKIKKKRRKDFQYESK